MLTSDAQKFLGQNFPLNYSSFVFFLPPSPSLKSFFDRSGIKMLQRVIKGVVVGIFLSFTHYYVHTFIEETRTSIRRLPALFFRATTNDSTTILCDSATTTSTTCHFLCPRASFSLSKTRI